MRGPNDNVMFCMAIGAVVILLVVLAFIGLCARDVVR